MMYIFREYTSLGRYKDDRVGFMNCMFSTQLQGEHTKYLANKKNHRRSSHILAYANGELPAHGKTGKKWGLHFDRIYAPIFVNRNHWISVCVNFVLQTVEVFDCYRHVNIRNVESFANIIPRVLKEIGVKINGKTPLLTPYKIIEVPLPSGLNSSACDCGVYALKYIESHFLGLRMDLINDENIGEARHKVAVDLWEAANDPVLIERMKMFEPPQMSSDSVFID